MNTMIAAISGEGMVHNLVYVLIIGLCVLVVWWAGKYFLTKFGAPPIALTVWNGLFVLLGVLCILNFLLSLVDKPFIKF